MAWLARSGYSLSKLGPLPLNPHGALQTCTQYVPTGVGDGHRTDVATHVSTLTIWLRADKDTDPKSKKARICRPCGASVRYGRARLQPLIRIRLRFSCGRRRDRQRDDAALAPSRPVQTHAREAPDLRIRGGADRSGLGPLPDALLHLRPALRGVRRRSDLPLSLGRPLPRAGLVRPG